MKTYYACYQYRNGIFDRAGAIFASIGEKCGLMLVFSEFESIRRHLLYGYGKIFLQRGQ